MHRFFIETLNGDSACVTGEDAHHMAKVLRLRQGETVMLCDGQGMECNALIESITPERVHFTMSAKRPTMSEPSAKITIYQGLPKQGKMELIIQKCVELGVCTIVPVACARSVVKLDKKDANKRIERYQRVAYEAAKQSHRGAVPKVLDIIQSFEMEASRHELMLVAYEMETIPLKEVLSVHRHTVKDIGIFIGPEGGLELTEVSRLKEQGAISISLGRRILRTETAGMAALAMILYELEN